MPGTLLAHRAVRVTAIATLLSVTALVVAGGLIEPAAAATYESTGEEAVLSSQEARDRLAREFSTVLLRRDAPDSMCLSVVIDDHFIVESQSSRGLVPASLMKLVTATAALDVMHPNETFKTEVFVRADALSAVVDGELKGDVYLVGGGDPVLSTPRYAERFPEAVAHSDITKLADRVFAALAAHGVTQVKGRVVGDDSWFPDGERDYTNQYPDGALDAFWKRSFVTANIVGPLSALLLNDGYSSYAWSTTSAGRRQNVRASDPARHAASVFDGLLEARGMLITLKARSGIAPFTAERTSVGAIESPPLSEILARMLGRSDNSTAEMLFKEIGRRMGGSDRASAAASVQATMVRKLGSLAEGLVVADGSGLSSHNRLTCAAIAELLLQAGPGSPLVKGLSVPWKRGTLRGCGPSSPTNNVIHAKTGTLSDVTALAGTAVTTSGEIVTFAMMANSPYIIGLGYCDGLRKTLLNAAARYNYGPVVSQTPAHAGDREALMTLFETTGGEDWFNSWGWGSDMLLNRWRGVATDTAGRVTEIDLSGPFGNGMTGTLPETIGALSELTRLDLSGNGLGGSLPSQVSDLTKLRELQLSGTSLCVSRALEPWKGWFEEISGIGVPICTSFVDTFGTVYAEPIEELMKSGILEGSECAESYICPEEPIDRSTFAVWLTRILGDDEPLAVSVSRFADVKAGLWWAAHVERLAELGITVGCGGDPPRYCPDHSVTRGQLAIFLTRALNLPSVEPLGFVDIVGGAFQGEIDAAAAAGVVGECADDPLRYCSGDSVTRGQAAMSLSAAYRINMDQSQGLIEPESVATSH